MTIHVRRGNSMNFDQVHIKKDLLCLFSPSLRQAVDSVAPCSRGPRVHLIAPDFEASDLKALNRILTEGCYQSLVEPEQTRQDVVEAARILGIQMGNLFIDETEVDIDVEDLQDFEAQFENYENFEDSDDDTDSDAAVPSFGNEYDDEEVKMETVNSTQNLMDEEADLDDDEEDFEAVEQSEDSDDDTQSATECSDAAVSTPSNDYDEQEIKLITAIISQDLMNEEEDLEDEEEDLEDDEEDSEVVQQSEDYEDSENSDDDDSTHEDTEEIDQNVSDSDELSESDESSRIRTMMNSLSDVQREKLEKSLKTVFFCNGN